MNDHETLPLPTVREALAAMDGEMIVQHDGVADYQTCSQCFRTWGAGGDEYAQHGIAVPYDDDGETCPDPRCGGRMGINAESHRDWIDCAVPEVYWDAWLRRYLASIGEHVPPTGAYWDAESLRLRRTCETVDRDGTTYVLPMTSEYLA